MKIDLINAMRRMLTILLVSGFVISLYEQNYWGAITFLITGFIACLINSAED